MFTSAGGSSDGLFASLNLSYHVGDENKHVQANRGLVQSVLGHDRICSAHQVHGDQILVVEAGQPVDEMHGYDALITTQPGTGLMIQQADCQAVLLSAPDEGIVAAIHCGWRGSVLNIIGKTIQRLRQQFGVVPAKLQAVISPSLGPCCAEFVHYRTELPEWMHSYQVRPQYFDFWAISRWQLEEYGIQPDHIDVTGLCTRCNHQFFSYRRASALQGGITGRNGSIIGLPPLDASKS
jgi:YfiH family protein